MTDLITRLRAMSRCEHDDLSIGDEAADEIERLRTSIASARVEHSDAMKSLNEAHDEIERLRAALQHIVSVMGPRVPPCCGGCAAEWAEALLTAREALGEQK